MLHIHIPFESSWTNSFADQNHEPLFTSGSSFGDANRGATPTTLPRDAAPNTMRVESVRALNRCNPEMAYRVPDSYDNTVKGVLARLLGEVRRLRDLESDHLVNQLVRGLSYEIKVTSEHDEIVSLATPANAIQSSGAGLLPPGNPLYERSPLTEHLFGHLGLPLAVLLEQGLEAKGTWVPGSPLDLVLKLDAIKDAQTALAKAIKKETGLEPDFMRQFALRLCAGLQEAQKLEAAGPSAEPDKWNVGGALLVAKLHNAVARRPRGALRRGRTHCPREPGGPGYVGPPRKRDDQRRFFRCRLQEGVLHPHALRRRPLV